MVNNILIGCICLPNGNLWPGPKFNYKLKWLKRLSAHTKKYSRKKPVALIGDYNVMPTEPDVYRSERWINDALSRI